MSMKRFLTSATTPLTCAMVTMLTSCAAAERPPNTAHVAGEVKAFAAVAARLLRTENTPAADAGQRLQDTLTSCPGSLWGTGDGLIDALGRLRCEAPPTALAPWLSTGPGELAVVLPLGAMGVANGRLAVDDAGQVTGKLVLHEDKDGIGPARMMIPASGGPGPARLSPVDAMIHFRVHARDGIDIAALAGNGGQGKDLFALDSNLFSGAILAGTWEFALYPSTPQEVFPPAALAVGLRSRTLGETAVREFLGALRARWPIDDTPRTFGPHAGGCLPTLHILPRLSPCYAFTDDDLVVAWNEYALHRALTFPSGTKTSVEKKSLWRVNLGSMGASDELITMLRRKGVPPASLPVPWSLVLIDGRTEAGSVVFDVRLVDKEGTP